MAIHKKRFVWQRLLWFTLSVTTTSFGCSFVLFRSLASHPATLLPTPQKQEQPTPTESLKIEQKLKPKFAALASGMLHSWEEQAVAKNLLVTLPQEFQAKTFANVKLSGSDKVIALTFDDGPWPKSTDEILNILKQHNIKATFFWIGQMVQNYPQLAQEVVADGQAIGNHTWHHWYRRMSPEMAASEIERTAAVIYKTTGVTTSLFRPPGGILRNGPAEYAKLHNYGIVMWSDDSEDYTRPSVSRLVRNVLRTAKPGGIVLMHDGGGNRSHTVEALPQIIEALTQKGYQFVTVPELLELKDKEGLKTANSPAPSPKPGKQNT